MRLTVMPGLSVPVATRPIATVPGGKRDHKTIKQMTLLQDKMKQHQQQQQQQQQQ
jgi:hypothetical protein